MKHILISIASVITITLAAWRISGFVVWDWNPKNWTEASRFTLVLISAAVSVPLVGGYLTEQTL